jgi:hypothetical protein
LDLIDNYEIKGMIAKRLTILFKNFSKRKKKWEKVFEVGVAKTGTSSLARAYAILDLTHVGWTPKLYYEVKAGKFESALEFAEKFQAFEDAPWHDFDLYKRLDKRFPYSKFILLERDDESWIKSMENHFSEHKNCNNIDNRYLIKNFHEKKQLILDYKTKRYKEVKKYFRNRPEDLLVMNICTGEGWEKLCPFLELPIPNVIFPHAYRTKR